jgi:hypothetical protein
VSRVADDDDGIVASRLLGVTMLPAALGVVAERPVNGFRYIGSGRVNGSPMARPGV